MFQTPAETLKRYLCYLIIIPMSKSIKSECYILLYIYKFTSGNLGLVMHEIMATNCKFANVGA